MSDMRWKIDAMLLDVILPNLKSVQANQAEQTMQAERPNRNLEQFRVDSHGGESSRDRPVPPETGRRHGDAPGERSRRGFGYPAGEKEAIVS